MGWVGLAAELVPLPGLGVGLGLDTEAAAGAEGAGVARAEEVVEDGVTAADWLRELGRAGQVEPPGAHRGTLTTLVLPQRPCTGKNLGYERTLPEAHLSCSASAQFFGLPKATQTAFSPSCSSIRKRRTIIMANGSCRSKAKSQFHTQNVALPHGSGCSTLKRNFSRNKP